MHIYGTDVGCGILRLGQKRVTERLWDQDLCKISEGSNTVTSQGASHSQDRTEVVQQPQGPLCAWGPWPCPDWPGNSFKRRLTHQEQNWVGTGAFQSKAGYFAIAVITFHNREKFWGMDLLFFFFLRACKQSLGWRGAEWAERISNRLPTELGAPHWAWSHNPEMMTLAETKSQSLDWAT